MMIDISIPSSVDIFHSSIRQFPNLDIVIPIRINECILRWNTNTISSLSIKLDLIRCTLLAFWPVVFPIKASDNTACAPLFWTNHAFNFISNFESQFTRTVPFLKNGSTANTKTIRIRLVSFQFTLIFLICSQLLLAFLLVTCLPVHCLTLPRAIERAVASGASFEVIRITTLITESCITWIRLHIHCLVEAHEATHVIEAIILLFRHHRNLPNPRLFKRISNGKGKGLYRITCRVARSECFGQCQLSLQ
mmetsp:Transcript_28258/g.40374  ORF Transcript_28258/g.40374 Transcript_28258/m.40374 type:complete len:250 (+) Transcript_28258:90-839(+)